MYTVIFDMIYFLHKTTKKKHKKNQGGSDFYTPPLPIMTTGSLLKK